MDRLYLFPSAHKSSYDRNGLLHAPLGEAICVPDVLSDSGAMLTISPEQRRLLAELEFVNSHDQNILEISDPAQNLWSYYQHVTVLPLLSPDAQAAVNVFKRLATGGDATCADIVAWHEGRFDPSRPMPDKWQRHIQMFKPGGKYFEIEKMGQRVYATFDLDLGAKKRALDGDGNAGVATASPSSGEAATRVARVPRE